MKKLIYLLITLLVIGGIVYTLASNKKEMEETAAIASRTSDAIPVVLTTPATGRMDRSFSVNGSFAPDQSLTLLSETQGQVISLRKEKGDRVKAGEVLAQVENEVLQANLITAQANFDKSRRDLERFQNLAAGDAITQRQLEEVKLGYENARANLIMAKQRLAKSGITAPISGIINESYLEIGSFLNPGSKLFDIVNVEKLKLKAKVSEQEVLLITQGDTAIVKADVMPEKAFSGVITAIGASADKAMKYDVEVEVRNAADAALRAGMYGTARFEIPDTREVLLLDREAIATSLQDPKVFVVKEGKAFLQEVSVGAAANGKVEILAGLEPGDQVVRSGQINLKNGTKVSILK